MGRKIFGIPVSELTDEQVIYIYDKSQEYLEKIEEIEEEYRGATCKHMDRETCLSEMIAQRDSKISELCEGGVNCVASPSPMIRGERETMLIEMVHERNEAIKASSDLTLAFFSSSKLYKQLQVLCSGIVETRKECPLPSGELEKRALKFMPEMEKIIVRLSEYDKVVSK